MTQNIIVQATKSLLIDLVGEILYFPIWWYGPGLKRTTLNVFNSIRNTSRNLALVIMLKSLFKTMFGQYDREGRIISFFMRLVLTFSRLLAFLFLALMYLIIIVLWLFLPLAVVLGLFFNFAVLWK